MRLPALLLAALLLASNANAGERVGAAELRNARARCTAAEMDSTVSESTMGGYEVTCITRPPRIVLDPATTYAIQQCRNRNYWSARIEVVGGKVSVLCIAR